MYRAHLCCLSSTTKTLLIAATLFAQACTFDAASLDELSCSQEGAVDNDSVCRDGIWIINDGTTLTADMSPTSDFALPVDMTAPDTGDDLDSQPDLDINMQDMRDDLDMAPDLSAEDMAAEDMAAEDMAAEDMTAEDMTAEDMTRDMPPEDMAPDLSAEDMATEDMAPDLTDMGPQCPTQDDELCARLRSETSDNSCFDLSSDRTLTDGCIVPAGTACDCVTPGTECVLTSGSARGTCQIPCNPESDGDYCARVQNSANANICGTSWQVLDNCGDPRPQASCDFCTDREQCDDPNEASVCVCRPLDPVLDKTDICARFNNPCNTFAAPDGCGAEINVSGCIQCGLGEVCQDNMNPMPSQPLSECVLDSPVEALSLPPGLPSNAQFGFSMAVDDDVLAIGAPSANVPGAGAAAQSCGAVYLYTLENNVWTYSDTLSDPTRCNTGNEEFGFSVDLKDGALAVGSPGDGPGGTVYTFKLDNTNTWVLELESTSSTQGSRLGTSVTISSSLNARGDYRMVAGAPFYDASSANAASAASGNAVAYRRAADASNNLSFFDSLINPSQNQTVGARYGMSVDFANTRLVGVGSPNQNATGAIYPWILQPNSQGTLFWNNQGSFNTLFWGEPPQTGDLYAQVVEYSDNRWGYTGSPGQESAQGKTYVVDLANPASTYTINPVGLDVDDLFGSSLDATGNAVIIGATGDDGISNAAQDTGAAHLYEWNGNAWTSRYVARIPSEPVDTESGYSVALSDDWLFFGAPQQNDGNVYMAQRQLLP